MVKKLLATSEKLFQSQSSSILSAATVITGANLLSAFLGIVRNHLLVSRFFGTEMLRQQLDAYWVAFRIPELVFQLLVVGALSAAFIPIYNKYRESDQEDANRMAASMMNIVILVFVGLSAIIFIGAEPFNRLITSTSFTVDQVNLAATLTRIMLLAQLFFAASNFMTGVIQANQRFLVPALSPLAYNLGIILGIVILSPMIGIYGPAVGVVVGALFHLLIQWPFAKKLGFHLQPKINWQHPGVKEMGRLMLPRALAISVDQVELMVSVYFATALSAGSLTMLNLAQQLMNAPLRIFSVPIGQASLPFLSAESAKGSMDKFKQTLTQTLNQVLFLAFPASALLLVLRIPLVRLAYGAAVFPWSATLTTGRLVALMTLAIFAYGVFHIMIRAFYALHDTKTPFWVALGSVVLVVILMAWLVWGWGTGVMGIGLALTIANILEAVVLTIIIQWKYRVIDIKLLIGSQIRIVFISCLMGLALWGPMRFLDTWVFDTTRTLPLVGLTVIVTGFGLGVYLFLAWLCRVAELRPFVRLIKKLNGWRAVLSASDEVLESAPQAEEAKPW